MSVARFLTDLFDSGRVVVAPDDSLELGKDIDQALTSAEAAVAKNFAGTTPAFSLPAARWAAVLLYRACRFLVCRDVDAKTIEQAFEEKCPDPRSPETDFSADIVFQYLPDVIRMTRAVASGDPLLQPLLRLARAWPLSSVGVAEVGPVETKSFFDHPGLRQLYADRIIERLDLARLGDPLVDAAVRESLGAFPELCPAIAQRLSASEPASPSTDFIGGSAKAKHDL